MQVFSKGIGSFFSNAMTALQYPTHSLTSLTKTNTLKDNPNTPGYKLVKIYETPEEEAEVSNLFKIFLNISKEKYQAIGLASLPPIYYNNPLIQKLSGHLKEFVESGENIRWE